MLTEEIVLQGYSILGDKAIRLSYRIDFKKDDQILVSSTKEELIIPGQDISDREDEIKAVCAAIWTQAVINAYRAPSGIQ